SLRTFLLALTALCVWLGWNANIVQQRKAMRSQEPTERAESGHSEFLFLNVCRPLPNYVEKQHMRSTRMFGKKEILIPPTISEGVTIIHDLRKQASPPTGPWKLSGVRQWLGDELTELVIVFDQEHYDQARARFPEASVYLTPPEACSASNAGSR
ncbi:MAG TPA: hypothetical protein VGJ26_00275, partial [Pirellulales bacterium]